MPNCSRTFSARSTDSTTSPARRVTESRPPCPGCRWSTIWNSPCGSRRRPSTSRCGWVIARSIRCRTGHFATWRRSGSNPIGNGPYQLADGPDGPAWEHNVRIDLKPNPDYHGNRKPHNKGLRFEFYANLDTAYADLLSGNLDVLDTIPSSALTIYKRDLGGNAASGPVAVSQSLDTPLRLPHFGGEEGRLRRLALSAAINRPQICQQIFNGTRSPARDFTARSLPGFDPNIPGNDALDFNPERARQLWAQANAISPWSGRYAIAYNADSGHQEWVDAVANSIKNVLGIDAVGAPQPTFAGFRTQITNRTIDTAFRAGWIGDYPSMIEFLAPLYATGAGSNDVGYSSREFDAALAAAEAAPSLHQADVLANVAQRILLHDMPAVPLWDYISVVGWSSEVSNVTVTWNGHARLREHREGLRWVGISRAGSPSWCRFSSAPRC